MQPMIRPSEVETWILKFPSRIFLEPSSGPNYYAKFKVIQIKAAHNFD
jgi:hypothetical protein